MSQPTDPLLSAGLPALRRTSRRWIIQLLDGPNMKYLGRRDPALFGSIASIEALHNLVTTFGAALGVQIDTFVSDYEGDLLKQVHGSAATADGYLVNPGGLTSVSEAWRHALAETRKPVVEVQFYNLATRNEVSVFTPSVIGRVMGFREYSYIAGLLGLVLGLDDETFLNPDAPDSLTVRRNGVPYAYKKG
jgi:3-dehydroquinate dehydratase-2